MNKYRYIDIDKSISQVFKYREFKEKDYIPIVILEDEEVVNLSGYEAIVYFRFSSDNVKSFQCLIIDNVVQVPLKEEYLKKMERVLFEIVFIGKEQIVTTFKMYLDI